MFCKHLRFLTAALSVMVTGSFAAAQAPIQGVPTPTSETSGYAGTALRSIYRRDVGRAFSVESLNQVSLRSSQARVPNVGQSTVRQSPSTFGVGTSPANKPFSSYSPEPTVSPYLNLFREDLQGNSELNYTTLVRPMLQQQQFNQQVQRQSMEMARRLQSVAAQANFNPQGSTTMFPTGHRSVFMYYGHYYPTAAQPRR